MARRQFTAQFQTSSKKLSASRRKGRNRGGQSTAAKKRWADIEAAGPRGQG